SEKALEESEKRYRMMFEYAGFRIQIFDAFTGERVAFNKEAYEQLGYTREEFKNLNISDIDAERSREDILGDFEKIIRHVSYKIEAKIKAKNGEIRDILISSVPIKIGGRDLIQSLSLDITDRKRAEQELRESEVKYRSMMESMKDPVYICSHDYRVEYMNSAMIRRTGHDATGEHCFKALHHLEERCPWCMHHKALLGVYYENDIVSPKDNLYYHVSNSPIVHEDGSISKMTIFRDMTDLKQMETQLREAQKIESIGILAGGIAHDFNNILSPIMIHSEMAMMELPPDSPVQKNLQSIYKSGEHARDLVKQILTFARRKETEKAAIRISPIMKETIKLLRSTTPSTIDIQYDLKAEQDTVLADPTQMNQIVMNLCANAAHAMREKGGVLEISLSDEYIGPDEIERFADIKPGHYLRLSVRDTGSGIAPDNTDKIFEPYYTTKGVGEGTGLGLSVVHGIVKEYGGDIAVESQVGRGTIFHVLFPVIEEYVSPPIGPKAEFSGGNERILFVDDEKSMVDAIQPMLEKLGYKVTARTSSIEALEAFRHKPEAFDIVITDMTMPNLTGKDLAKKLMDIRSDIPIILCTGFSEQIDDRRAKEIGISSFVMKPIVMEEMAKRIREVLDKK
ncbi:PAS domain S-box protein, partial [Thermodesulfobacteriota bacterium]